jgi:protein-disulfide isomerase
MEINIILSRLLTSGLESPFRLIVREKRVLMSNLKTVLVACACLLVLATVSAAQAQRRPRPTPTPMPAKASASVQSATPPGTLAIVHGQPITLDDLDLSVRDLVNNLDKEIATARRAALDAKINTMLFEAEAMKRKVTVEQLLNQEVNSRVVPATEGEIRAVYDANSSQLATVDAATARQQIILYIRNQRTQSSMADFAQRLRMMHVVENGPADVNAPNLAPNAVLATVAGRTITAGAFEEQLKPAIYELRHKVYDAQKHALDEKIYNALIVAEAKRRNTTPEEVIRTEVTDKVKSPTDEEVAKFYEANRAKIEGDLASRRADIIAYLEQVERLRLEQALANRLRVSANLQMLMKEPVAPVQAISTDDDPTRGDAKAPVTMVVFTDFQCPACAATHPIIDEVVKSYGHRVRLVVRDYPLEMHAQARKAAEAANAANAQGKFFEYIELLFKNQSALDVESLKKYASTIGLDRAKFDAALDGGVYAEEVSKDMADGQQYGVLGTPTIFINGVRLNQHDLNDKGIRAGIERALGGTHQAPARATK